MHSRRCRKVALLVALGVFALCMLGIAGCKYTDVLIDKVEDPLAALIDERMAPIYREVPDSDNVTEDDSFMQGESDRIDEQVERLPVYDPNGPDAGVAINHVHKEEDPHEEDATESDEAEEEEEEEEEQKEEPTASEAEKEDDKKDEEDTAKPDSEKKEEQEETQTLVEDTNQEEPEDDEVDENASGKEPSEETPNEDETTPEEEGDIGEGEPSGGEGGDAQVYDDGTYEDLPEDVGCVAATGQYATIVQMLAGKGGLVAADEEWLAMVADTGAFPNDGDEGISSVKAGWSGDGTGADSIRIDDIIAAKPDCVLVGNGSRSITQEQQDKLVKAGISVVVMPDLGASDTPDVNITQAVKVVAQLLRTAPTMFDVGAMADEYIRFHDSALEACLSGNGGYSGKLVDGTLFGFIYQGTDSTGYATTNITSYRITTAYIEDWTPAASSSVTAVRSFGNASMYLDGEQMDVSEGVGLSARATTDNFMLLDYYLQIAGVANNAYDTAKPTRSDTALPYLVVAGSGDGLVSKSITQRSTPSALWVNMMGGSSEDSWTTVGDDDFPAIIVSSVDIAEKVAASASRVNGLYNVGQPYGIYVMPSGIAGSWAKGTVESFLAAPWAYGMFQIGGDASVGEEYANSYCKTFYRCDASSALSSYGESYVAECPR